MIAFYVALVLVQIACVVILMIASVGARLRIATARRDLAGDVAGAGGSRRLARAAWRAVADAPASRRASLPRQEVIEGHHARLIDLLRNTTTGVERGQRRREQALATGTLLLLSRSSNPQDANELFRALFSGAPGITAHASLATGLSTECFTGASVVLMSVLRNLTGLGSSTMLWAIERVFAQDPDQLTMMAKEPEPRLRALIVTCAGRAAETRRGSATAEPLRSICRSALSDPSDIVRAAAARSLGTAADGASIAVLESALSDTSEIVQRAAADALAATRQSSALLILAEKLATTTTEMRHHILASIANEQQVPPPVLLRWLSSEDGTRVVSALEVLAVSRVDQRVVDSIFSAVGHVDVLCSRAAAHALAALARSNPAWFRMNRNFDRLISQLENDDVEAVGFFVEALALTGDQRAIGPLMARIPLSGRYIREKVVESLALLELMRDRAEESSVESSTLVLSR